MERIFIPNGEMSVRVVVCRVCHLPSPYPHNIQSAASIEKVSKAKILLKVCVPTLLGALSDRHTWSAAELPLEFPDGTTPVMSRVCIYDSAVGGGVGVGAPLKIALPPQLPLGSLYMEEVHAEVSPFC